MRPIRKTFTASTQMIGGNGKYSHSTDTKVQLFSTIYQMFPSMAWKSFFYMCMEEKKIWDKVLIFLCHNEDFDTAMKVAYLGDTKLALI